MKSSVQDGCALWGACVLVPEKGRQAVFTQLHDGHPGCSRMKGIARTIVWWPGIDSEIEGTVRKCLTCQQQARAPPLAPLCAWEWPEKPWSRLHVDYARPFMGAYFFVIVDARTKWMNIHHTGNSCTSAITIEKLRDSFATHGLPDTLVSDSGPCFVSQEFEGFMKGIGIRLVRTAPYHPASNGFAERAVQSFKAGTRKQSSGSVKTKLAKFLLNYRTASHSTTGVAPAQLLMGRRLTTSIDRLFPDVSRKVVQTQLQQKNYHDQHVTYRLFQVQDRVFIRNYANGPIWVPGVILAVTGPLSYDCQLVDGRRVRRHQDQLLKREIEVTPPVVREELSCGEGLPEMVDSFQKAPDPVVAGGPFDLTLEDSLVTPEEPVI